MRLLRLFVILLLAAAFRGSSPAARDLPGTWKEYYGLHGESDVNYNDVHSIDVSGKDINIICVGREYYGFEEVSYRRGTLKLRMRNPANGTFFVDYTLKMNEEGTELLGDAINIHGKKSSVKWVKFVAEGKKKEMAMGE